MFVRRFAILTILAVTSLAAQSKPVEPIPSPLPTQLEPVGPPAPPSPATDFVSHLKAGMSEDTRVAEIVGRPRDRHLSNDYARRIIGGDSAEVWESPKENLLVIFEHGKVASFRAVSPALTDSYAWEWKAPSEMTEPQFGSESGEPHLGSGGVDAGPSKGDTVMTISAGIVNPQGAGGGSRPPRQTEARPQR